MTFLPLPDRDYLLKRLRYDPETGKLFWLSRPFEDFQNEHSRKTWNSRFSGKEALNGNTSLGYIGGRINYKRYAAHRVIWKMMTGEEPIEVDHINGVRDDNRWRNLRSVSPSENRKNMRLSRYNKSGVSGVAECKDGWTAKITINNKSIWLGLHSTKAEAVAARVAAERVAGFHPNHGRWP